LKDGDWTIGFQSRLGRTPWIKPFTDELLPELAQQGVRRLLVSCPSFVTDCLETLEEIGIRAREDFIAAGGEDLRLVPCVNSTQQWVEAMASMVGAATNERLESQDR
jgi:ferrochelatase